MKYGRHERRLMQCNVDVAYVDTMLWNTHLLSIAKHITLLCPISSLRFAWSPFLNNLLNSSDPVCRLTQKSAAMSFSAVSGISWDGHPS